MNSNPLVSIITVCYNSQNTISKTLDSVCNQSYSNIEYILIDGQSKDNTINIINQYVNEYKFPIYVISEPDHGIYDAMNKGIKYSHGKYIGIINSDDYYELDAVEKIINSSHFLAYEVLYGEERCLKNGNEKSILFYNHHFLDEQMIAHPACFISKSIYDKYGLYDTNYKSAADYEFFLRIKDVSDITFIPIYSIIANFSYGGISGTFIGTLENAKVRRKYKKITLKQYYLLCFKAYLKKIIGDR